MPNGGGRVSASTFREGNLVMVHFNVGGCRQGVIEEIDWRGKVVFLSDEDGEEFESSIDMIDLTNFVTG